MACLSSVHPPVTIPIATSETFYKLLLSTSLIEKMSAVKGRHWWFSCGIQTAHLRPVHILDL